MTTKIILCTFIDKIWLIKGWNILAAAMYEVDLCLNYKQMMAILDTYRVHVCKETGHLFPYFILDEQFKVLVCQLLVYSESDMIIKYIFIHKSVHTYVYHFASIYKELFNYTHMRAHAHTSECKNGFKVFISPTITFQQTKSNNTHVLYGNNHPIISR